MFGIGMQELMIILLVALVVIGPKKLPEVAKQIAKGVRELRKASDDLRHSIMVDIDEPYRPPARSPPARRLPPTGEAGGGSEGAEGAEGSSTDEAPPNATITGSVLAGAEGTVSRGADDGGEDHPPPDPMDADDYSGMPYGPGSAEIDELVAKARARQQAEREKNADLADRADRAEKEGMA